MPPINRLQSVIVQLEHLYGLPQPPKTTDPFEMILLENVAYLVRDEKREQAFDLLRNRVGLSAGAILSASDEELFEVAELGGMDPGKRVNKLRTIAQIALQEFEGDLNSVLKRTPALVRRALKRFPGIGDPGVEKILLFSRTQPILALESNGLRVLVRLGFGKEEKSYAATYSSVRESLKGQMSQDFDWLIATHQLLRRHGQELCKGSHPACKNCPLTNVCRFYEGNIKESDRHV